MFILNVDSGELTSLGERGASGGGSGQIIWSPDGNKIAFSERDGETGVPDIYVIDKDGTNFANITNTPDSFEGNIKWSPDSNKFIFFRNLDIFTMKTDGTEAINLTNNPGSDANGDWSPDGSKIVFTSNRDEGHNSYEIYVMNADGNAQIRLTNKIGRDENPEWSPDGSKIAFKGFEIVDSGYYSALYVMNANGSGLTKITGSDLSMSYLQWY